MTTTNYLGIPLIAGQQNQPEVTHNQALAMIQALAMGVLDFKTAPPGSPADFDAYILNGSATGAWAGHDHKIAIFFGGWLFIPGFDSDGVPIAIGDAQEGLSVWVRTHADRYTWFNGAWVRDGKPLSS